MTANSPSSYSVSLMLHGAFVAALVLTAFVLKDQSLTKQPKILELVVGPGDKWAATDAPAAGTPTGVKFEPVEAPPKPVPVAPAPQPQAEPVVAPAPVQLPPEPVVVPVQRAPVTPAPVETVTPKKTEVKKPEPKTFTQTIKEVSARKERQTIAQFRKEQAAQAKAEAKARELEEKRKKLALASKNGAVSFQKIEMSGITDGVSGGTTDKPGSNGKALSRDEQDQLETYFALLKQKLRAAHEKPAGVSDLLAARVEFLVAANGAIGQVRIIKSSGNAEFDQSVLAAFSAVRTIGPRPDGRSDKREATFQMKEEE